MTIARLSRPGLRSFGRARTLGAAVLTAVLGTALPVGAQSSATAAPPETVQQEVERLRRQIEEMRHDYDARLATLEAQLSALAAQGPGAPPAGAPAAPAAQPTAPETAERLRAFLSA